MRALYRLFRSFSAKLVALALILLSVPLIMYWQFQRAEWEQAKLLRNSASQTGRVIAAMLRPRFERFSIEAPKNLSDALKAAAVGSTNIKVLVRPAGSKPDEFIYVGAYPQLSAPLLKEERAELIRSGVFANLAPTCDGATDLSLRFLSPSGRPEILTSMTPVHAAKDCWIVITSQNAADLAPVPLDTPIWTTPPMRMSVAVYLVGVALIIGLFVQIGRNIARFQEAARLIRLRNTGAASFQELNNIPELAHVAGDFDALVAALVASQDAVRKTAEESAHSLKAPLAVISQSLEPIRRAISPSDAPANRALQLVERSLGRLDALVTSARDIEQATADAVYPERKLLNVSDFLKRLIAGHEVALSLQGKRLSAHIDDGITAYANEDLMETAIENLLDNAASYTKEGQTVEVRLARRDDLACITVADRGPGVDAEVIPRIFDRYVSNRPIPRDATMPVGSTGQHAGLGLWIVKRNIEGLGGTVAGRNREEGGFEVVVCLRNQV